MCFGEEPADGGWGSPWSSQSESMSFVPSNGEGGMMVTFG